MVPSCWFGVWWLLQAQLSALQGWWSHLQSCQAGPQQLPELPSSSWEHLFFQPAGFGSWSCPEEPRFPPGQDASTLQEAEDLFLLGCSVCLGVHGGPGDGSRVGRMLTLSDTKPFPRQQRLPSDVWMCSQSLHPSSAQHFHDLGPGEPGNLPNLDHLSSHFIPGCSGSMVSSDLLAEAMGGSMDLGWHVGLGIVLALLLQGGTGSRRTPSSSSSL